MKIALVGSRWFGAEMFTALQTRSHDLHVVAPDADDRLAALARENGVSLSIHSHPYRVTEENLPEQYDVVIAAYSHARIPLDRAKIATLGYHPSLLPRWRGIAAVDWTIKANDPIAGGSVYHLSDEMDAGGIAAQDWCFVLPDEDAASLWRRALAPMGLRLLTAVVDEISETGTCKAIEQDERFMTLAPRIKAQ
ncbi:formyltransferase family protein [Terrihabitans sp. B22-R8]|uniref:formyltransferase family protein n=1 Tax=Terrihabitans sp. B22-R8 TaxID=3425128 RepID=UPI00403D4BF7